MAEVHSKFEEGWDKPCLRQSIRGLLKKNISGTSFGDLSTVQVQSMPNLSIRRKTKWGFFGHSTINHEYIVMTFYGDKVVIV